MSLEHRTENEGALSLQSKPAQALNAISFAEYKPVPPDTRSPLQRVRALSWRFLITSLAILMVAPFVIFVCLHARFGYLFFNGGKFILLGLGACWAWARFHIAPDSLKRMMDFPAAEPQFPVHLTCKSDKDWEAICQDEGIITFTGGLLHFEGRRISLDIHQFSIKSGSWSLYQRSSSKTTRKTDTFSFQWQGAGQSGKIEINVYDQVRGQGSGYRNLFKIALEDWCREIQTQNTRMTLPPRRADPLLMRRYEAFKLASLATGAGAVLAMVTGAIMSHGIHAEGLVLLPVAVFIVSLIFAWRFAATLRNASSLEQKEGALTG